MLEVVGFKTLLGLSIHNVRHEKHVVNVSGTKSRGKKNILCQKFVVKCLQYAKSPYVHMRHEMHMLKSPLQKALDENEMHLGRNVCCKNTVVKLL
jgi:hypothetical protein